MSAADGDRAILRGIASPCPYLPSPPRSPDEHCFRHLPSRSGPRRPAARPSSYVRDIALVVGGAALTGIAAQLAVPVPGSPVPVSGQTFAALLVGTALGARRGFLSLALYAVAGIAGVPWFAEGASGYAMPSFGYILGMLLAATVVGALARRGADRSVLRTAGAWLLGSVIIYAVGVPIWRWPPACRSRRPSTAAGLTPVPHR